MSRESVEEKGRRYLTESRVAVELVDAETVHATVKGSDAVYMVGYSGGVWACSCPARGRCAHLVAVGRGAEACRVTFNREEAGMGLRDEIKQALDEAVERNLLSQVVKAFEEEGEHRPLTAEDVAYAVVELLQAHEVAVLRLAGEFDRLGG